MMIVVDSDTGKITAALPIGKGTDAAAFDPTRKLAFSSSRNGTLTVVQEANPEHYTILGNVVTELGARTMAVDPANGDVFLVTARAVYRRAEVCGRSAILQICPRHAETPDLSPRTGGQLI